MAYLFLFKTIISDMKTTQKLDNNLITWNIFPLNVYKGYMSNMYVMQY